MIRLLLAIAYWRDASLAFTARTAWRMAGVTLAQRVRVGA